VLFSSLDSLAIAANCFFIIIAKAGGLYKPPAFRTSLSFI
jgi:hypothetical protein